MLPATRPTPQANPQVSRLCAVLEPYRAATGYHQDLPYLPLDRKFGCTLWIVLVDLPANSGTLRFIDGSHEWGPLGRYDGLDHDWLKEHPEVADQLSAPNALKAGDATFHHVLTMHGTD